MRHHRIGAGEGIQSGQRPIGADFEHGAMPAVVERAAAVSRAIEIAVAALHQPGLGISAIIAAGEEYKLVSAPLVLILNTVPEPFVPPAVSRAIEIAVAALHQPGMGICAIIAAGEGIQTGQRPIGADFEHGARAVRAAVVSRAIEIAVAALHQPGLGICAIIAVPVKEYKLVSAPLVLILNTVP